MMKQNKTWLTEIFGEKKPVIGLVHIRALPGTICFQKETGLSDVVARARQDYDSLVSGGIDSVVFCNEFDKPYSKCVGPHIVASMTAIINKVLEGNRIVPFGVDVQWDPKAALAIAMATGGSYIRGIVCGAYCGDLGLLIPNPEEIAQYRNQIGAGNVKILTNLLPEFSAALDSRPLTLRAQTAIKSSLVDGLCVSGFMAGGDAPYEQLIDVKKAVGDFPVVANTGVKFDNVRRILEIADACCVATCLKVDGNANNPIDVNNVRKMMACAAEGKD